MRQSQSITLSALLLLANIVVIKLPLLLRSEITSVKQPRHTFNDAESQLALRKRLALSSADMYALELIPGVSDTLAQRIIARRDGIHRIATYLRPGHTYRAFEVIHGIGEKTAQKLANSLDPQR